MFSRMTKASSLLISKFLKAFALVSILIIFNLKANGQLVEKYGIRIGGGLSKQIIKNEIPFYYKEKTDYKFGFCGFLNIQNKLSNHFSLNTELGYVQKGFQQEIIFTDGTGNELGLGNPSLTLHNLTGGLSIKFHPIKTSNDLYLKIGTRIDYLVGFDDYILTVYNYSIGFYEPTINFSNKWTLGGVFGLGYEMKEIVYIDVEFNPTFTDKFPGKFKSIKDSYLGLTLGLNINKLKKN
jgi:hypothetical protein